ncbi:hypothetical protein ABPG74_007772 [Tetrahymena malaccensis]
MSQRESTDIQQTTSIYFQPNQQLIESIYLHNSKQIYVQSDQLIVILGANDEFKQQNVSFLSDQMIQSSQPILKLENEIALISFPMKDDLDLQKKINLWDSLSAQLSEKQLIFTIILDQKQLIQSKEKLKTYLVDQLQVLKNSVSDIDLLLQLKLLNIVVQFVSKNGDKDELFNNEIKLLKEKIHSIYWEEQQNKTFRTFLYFLIQTFSSEAYYFQFYKEQKSRRQLLTWLQEQQSINSDKLTIKTPEDVQNQKEIQCVEKIMNLELESYNIKQLYELFCQLSKSKVNLSDIYYKKIQTNQKKIYDSIEQIRQNYPCLNQYVTLLNNIKDLESFEQQLSSLNLTKLVKIDDFVENIQQIFQLQLTKLNLNEIKDFLKIMSIYSEWNKKFKLEEMNLKQKIGNQLNQILAKLINRSESESFSQLISDLHEIIEIITNSQQNIQEFFTQSQIVEIQNQLNEIHSTCCNQLETKINILQNQNPNFKSILTNLQYCQQLIQVLNAFSYKKYQLEDIFNMDFNKLVEECENNVKKLQNKLEKIKQDISNNENLSILIFREKEVVKQVYNMLNIPIQINESNMQNTLKKQIQECERVLNDLISSKQFGEDFVNKVLDLERREKALNNNMEATIQIEKSFKQYFNGFLEDYKQINSENIDFKKKSSLRAEKTKLDNLKQQMKIKNEPKYLLELLNNLPQNNQR